MPTNKNALTRIMILDKLLADRYHNYSIKDITDYLCKELSQYGIDGGVTKRCVEKDIEYLEFNSPFDVELERYTIQAYSANGDKPYRKRCIRYVDPTYSIFKPKLTIEEKTLLSSALSTIGSFDGLENFGWLDDLRQRLGLVEKKPVIIMSKNLVENSSIIAQLFTAINAKSVIKLKYHKFTDSESKELIITPYLLKEFNCRWYLIGATIDTRMILNFALDRIEQVSIAEGCEYVEQPEDLLERYEDIIGVTYFTNCEVETIIFWASEFAWKYIDTKPLHGSQMRLRNEREKELRKKYSGLKNGAFFQIKCKENYELIRELCAYGGDLRVLSPAIIVDTIKQRIKAHKAVYKR